MTTTDHPKDEIDDLANEVKITIVVRNAETGEQHEHFARAEKTEFGNKVLLDTPIVCGPHDEITMIYQ